MQWALATLRAHQLLVNIKAAIDAHAATSHARCNGQFLRACVRDCLHSVPYCALYTCIATCLPPPVCCADNAVYCLCCTTEWARSSYGTSTSASSSSSSSSRAYQYNVNTDWSYSEPGSRGYTSTISECQQPSLCLGLLDVCVRIV
jgi:hypothetical protein